MRGLVVPLTAEQRVQRMLYLAGEAPLDSLDPFVRKASAPQDCPSLTYRLRLFNGGKDPTAPDPSTPFMGFRFCDCSGAGAWTQGHDRYQPKRAAHVYKGWLNTNSKIADALGARRCFVPVDRPTPGDIIVCASDERIGHEGGIVGYKLGYFDPRRIECWEAIEVVDVAARKGRANRRTTGRGWFFRERSYFLRCIMLP